MFSDMGPKVTRELKPITLPHLFCTFAHAGPISQSQPQGRNGQRAKRQKKDTCPSVLWAGCPELIRVPKAWFLDPLRQSIQTLVRPCTGLTRRKQLTIKCQLPFRCFMDFMSPLEDGSVGGLERDHVGRLVPTSETPAMKKYQYVIRRGSQHDKVFALQQHETQGTRRSNARWRRSMGCARLHLSHAAEARGHLAQVMAMICGNVVVDYKEPRGLKRMPRLTLRLIVLSMDREGHIIWPVDFEARTKAALRKQARALLQIMLGSPESYPVTDATWQAALTEASESRLQLRPPRRMIAAPDAAPAAPMNADA